VRRQAVSPLRQGNLLFPTRGSGAVFWPHDTEPVPPTKDLPQSCRSQLTSYLGRDGDTIDQFIGRMSDRIALKSRQIARSRGRPSGSVKILEFDRDRRLLTKNGHQLRKLTPQEALTLDSLIGEAPSVVTNQQLQNLLWPDTEVTDPQQRIRDIVADLRKALGDSPKSPCYIETTSGVGYSFVGTIEASEDKAPSARPISPPLEPANLPTISVSPLEPVPDRSVSRSKLLIASGPAMGGIAVLALIGAFLYVYWRAHRPAAQATIHPERTSPLGNKALPRRFGRLFAQSTSQGKAPIHLNIGYDIGWLLVTPDGKVFYVIELAGRAVTVLGVDDLQIERTFQLPHAASGAVISGDGRHIYIGSPDDVVMVIDAKSGNVERLIPTGGSVFDLAVTPDEKKLFLAMGAAGFKRIFTKSGEAVTLSEFACPLFLSMDGEGKRLFVSYQCGGPGGRDGHDVVEIYDTTSEQRLGVIGDIPMVGGRPILSPRGDYLLLSALDACVTEKYDHVGCPSGAGQVYHLIRTSDRSVVKSFIRPIGTYGEAFSADGGRLVFGGKRLAVVDWAKLTVTETAPVQENTYGIFAFAPTGARTFVASPDRDANLLVFDTEGPECGSPNQGLVNRYTGDGTFDDSIGTSALRAVGIVTFEPGLVGQAFRFSGKGAFLEGIGGASCWPCAGDWTESFFTKFESIDEEMTLLERKGSSIHWHHRIYKTKNNRLALEAGDGSPRSSILSSNSVEPNKWYHVAVTAEGNSMCFYLDGVSQGRLTLSEGAPTENGRGIVTLGASRGNKASLNGLIDEIAWYGRAVSASEAMHLSRAWDRHTCRP
jgi:DNA-binding winged helix-turn-helix (wHTH) protein/WD40 repeat protein